MRPSLKRQPASQLIAAENAGREPERLAFKYAAMKNSRFSFLRGSCRLFHTRLSELGAPSDAPLAWCCADLHLENFGTYVGDNALTYFDVNDFDEAVLVPADRDILRLATSVLVAAPELGIAPASARTLADTAIKAYLCELQTGKARWIERRTAEGAIGDLLQSLRRRDPEFLLKKRTRKEEGKTVLRLDNGRALPLLRGQRTRVTALVRAYGEACALPKPLRILDAARRVAGTGSLGIERYVVLVENGSVRETPILLDVKAARPSSALVSSAPVQPNWESEAHRVVAIQRRCQAIAPALLTAVRFEKASFVVKELQPSTDRLDLSRLAAELEAARPTLATMGRLIAWAQLRAVAHQGAASPDLLAEWSRRGGLSRSILAMAKLHAKATDADWIDFSHDLTAGQSGLLPA